jgi:hypothetical protein
MVCNAEAGSHVSVFDITGRVVTNTVVNSTEVSIPVATSGMYIVRVGTQTAKVVVND